MTQSVWKEISLSDYPGAYFFRDSKEKGHFSVLNREFPYKGREDLPASFAKIGRGEMDSILALMSDDSFDFIIIDDGKGAHWLRAFRQPYINALLCPKILFLSSHLSMEQSQKIMESLLQMGRYSHQVIRWANSCTFSDLNPFLPQNQ